jgi:hypothetical protein
MRWIDKAPIRIVEADEFERLAKQFIALHKTFKAKAVRGAGESAAEAKQFKDDWNDSLESRSNQADVYRHAGRKVVYAVDGEPAALMVLERRPSDVHVEHLAANALVSGAAEVMLEWAAGYSQHEGFGGVLTLFDQASVGGLYAKLGFVAPDPGDTKNMRLDPAQATGIWRSVGGEWKLQRYLNADGTPKTRFLGSLEQA